VNPGGTLACHPIPDKRGQVALAQAGPRPFNVQRGECLQPTSLWTLEPAAVARFAEEITAERVNDRTTRTALRRRGCAGGKVAPRP
jgi:hypothetical protein